jgi:hypothetical protein
MSGPSETIAQEGPYVPFVIETADYGFALPRDRYTDAELMTFVFDGDPIPSVPLPDSFYMLAGTLLVAWAALWLARRQA